MKFRTNCCKHLTRVRYFVQQQKTRTGNDRSSSRPREQSRCDKPAVNVSIPLQGRLYCYHKKKKDEQDRGERTREDGKLFFFFVFILKISTFSGFSASDVAKTNGFVNDEIV